MCTSLQFEPFHVLLLRKNATELLLDYSPRGARLPVLTIPAETRTAEELTRSVRDSWGLRAYCLLTLPIEDSIGRAAIFEATSPSELIPGELQWRRAASLCQADFDDPASFAAMEHSLHLLDRYRHGKLPGTFAQPACLPAITDWVEQHSATLGFHLTGVFWQLSVSPTFSLIRFETTGPALWFKAVGQPNLHEYSITRKLAAEFPRFAPRFLASHPEWNAWLSIEAEGSHLTTDSPHQDWERAAAAFAQLQVATFGSSLHLIAAGCRDLRTQALRALVAPYFDFADELMDQQTKPTPAPLSRNVLRVLREQVEVSLDRLEGNNLPNVLGHLDLNPGNILVSETGCVFLDWAEGAVGQPFFSFEYLREHWKRLHRAGSQGETSLLSAYSAEWRSFVSPAATVAALTYTPLLAAFALASAVADALRHRPEKARRNVAPYLRSLTRRMKREADALEERRAVCVL
jgi:hypothetical protein